MFKNRVRTAALAGAIAVATGVSGLSVPAYAAPENPQTDNHFNQPDGSRAGQGTELENLPATGEVKAADELRNRANDDKDAINAHEFEPFSPIKHRPVEEESKAKAAKKEAEATELLNRATKTLDDASATLNAVAAETKAANDAWAAYATAVSVDEAEWKELRKLEKKYADAGAPGWSEGRYTDHIEKVTARRGSNNYLDQVQKSRESIEGPQGEAGTAESINNDIKAVDQRTEQGIDELNRLTTFQKKLMGYLEGFQERDARYAKAVELTNTATSRNLPVLKEAFERAQKNVRAARTVQAYYGVAARWLDLYENDALRENEENTIRAEYFAVLFDPTIPDRTQGANGVNKSLEELASLAVQNVDNELTWENPVQRLRLLDKKYTSNGGEKANVNDSLARIADSLESLENGGKDDQGKGGQDKGDQGKGDQDKGDKDKGDKDKGDKDKGDQGSAPAKTDNKGLKIFGIIAGIIAGIAALAGIANLPQVKAMLNI